MKKSEFIEKVSLHCGVMPELVESVLDGCAQYIVDKLNDGHVVQIPKVGTLIRTARAERSFVNPNTRQVSCIPARYVLRVKSVSKAVKRALQSNGVPVYGVPVLKPLRGDDDAV